MATENAVVGVDLKSRLNANLIALHTSSSMSISPELVDLIVKADAAGQPTDFARRVQGVAEWSAEHEGPLAGQGDAKPKVADQNMSLKLKVDANGDGSATLVEVPLLDSVEFTLEQEMAETGGLDQPLWRYLRPDTRDFEISVSGTYVEPSQSGVHKALLQRVLQRSADQLPFELQVLGVTFTGEVEVGDTSVEAETGGEDATIDLTLSANSDLSKSGSFESSIEAAFAAYMNKQPVDVGMLHYDGSSPETGTTKLSGAGYYSELAISMERGSEVTVSGTVEGDGALSMGTA
ncbi:hypothetical protein GGQ13_003049 [Salinibacter ruber]|uniref:hypothetical protein n=1 Tax=Salinibacter ruber TaxID=146919 RepID=UPI0021691FCD|nr:hypothetical protein [Salinibacter ruber]MCS4139594.1 hypothetical protein [Salinibacter ruber]